MSAGRRAAAVVLMALGGLVVAGGAAWAEEHDHGKPAGPTNPAFEKVKSLAGNWEGVTQDGEKKMPTKESFKVVSGGSAVLNILGEGTQYEMVTMFHLDGQDLLATHYCGANNQPRLKLVPGGAADKLTFEFKDGTNLAAGAGRMHRLVISFPDAQHRVEEWTYLDKGKESTMRFEFARKK